MKSKIWKSIALVLALLCILTFPIGVSATAQGTNGDELQVAEPEQLVIQLGEDWIGVEFELKTDAGMYPGTIAVGEDGVLRLEIGGSKNYTLSCLNSSVSAPSPEDSNLQGTELEGSEDNFQTNSENSPSEYPSELDPTESGEAPTTPKQNTEAGIPTTHLVIFGVGLVVAIGALISLKYLPKKNTASSEYDDEDE